MPTRNFYDLRGQRITIARYWEIKKSISAVIAQDKIGDMIVSTQWVGFDTSDQLRSPAHIFETAVLGGPYDSDFRSSASYVEALEMHTLLCSRAEYYMTA